MFAATLLALAAAVLHAGWNLLIKTSVDRELAAFGQFAFGGVLFSPLLIVAGVPRGGAWPFLVISALIHGFYVEALVRAYHHGDFSFSYPLARGGGALVAALGGAAVLGDGLPATAWLALGVVAAGLASLVRPGTQRVSVLWAGLTAAIIGTYTVVDAAGVRHNGRSTIAGLAYGVSLTLCAAVVLAFVGLAKGRGREFIATVRGAWWRYVISGACLTGAYSLVLVAVAIKGVQVGYVATLRESSVVLGALAGWILLRERMGARRLGSSAVVLVGMIGLVVARR